MADTTYSVKVDEELKQKIIKFVKESGTTGKEFFAKLIEMYEMEKQEDKNSVYAREMRELEGHLTRIKNLYKNLLEELKIEAETLRDKFNKDLEKEKVEKESLTQENATLKDKIKELNAKNKKLEEDNVDLKKQVKHFQSVTETNNALIFEYKEKIDELKSSISTLKSFEEENKKMKKAVDDMKKYVESLELEKRRLKEKVDSLQSNISNLRKNHSSEIETINSKAEFEKEAAVAKEKQLCQEKIESLMNEYMKKNEEFSKTLRSLYSQIDTLREELSKEKNKSNKKTRG